jgi:hypothetical protein
MKLFLFFALSAIIFCSCTKEPTVKVEISNAEAFAFDLGNLWEVNATAIVKGFAQNREGDNYLATIAYDVDLITPAADTIKSMISRVEDKTNHERITDLKLEVQFELDSTYSEGDYIIIFNIKDVNSGQTTNSPASFTLINE